MIDSTLLLDPTTTIRDAIDHLVRGGRKAVFIVDGNMLLLGLFTNGDMRSILLKRIDFSHPISEVMNPKPIVFPCVADALDFSKGSRKLIVYPIVSCGYLVDVIFDDDERLAQQSYKTLCDVPLVIVAGGKGTRLYPYTKVLPKALIPIGDLTVTERIIQSFARYGCKDVFMILNHKANMIKAYFNDLRTDYKVHFSVEDHFLGTAGGLSLIKTELKRTFIVSNCDILIDDDLSCAYNTHRNSGNVITVVCSSKCFTVPYGVIRSNESGEIISLQEKPKLQYLVNTGVYVMEPEALELIGHNETMDMTDLIERCVAKGLKVGVFPVSDQAWLDMGQFDDMNRMLEHFRLNERRSGDE